MTKQVTEVELYTLAASSQYYASLGLPLAFMMICFREPNIVHPPSLRALRMAFSYKVFFSDPVLSYFPYTYALLLQNTDTTVVYIPFVVQTNHQSIEGGCREHLVIIRSGSIGFPTPTHNLQTWAMIMMMNLCSSIGSSSSGLGLSLIRGREERKPMVVALCRNVRNSKTQPVYFARTARPRRYKLRSSASELLPEYYTSRWLGACRRQPKQPQTHTRTTTSTTTVEALALESERARKRASVREAANVALNVRTPTHHSASP